MTSAVSNEVILSGGDLMKPMTWERSWIFAVLSLACLLAGCGGGSSTVAPVPAAPAPVSVAVSVSPSSATLIPGATWQFTATVTGSANTVVTWSVQEPAGGSITNAGLYTSPNTAGTFHVVATSLADPSKTYVATVNVPPVSVSVSITPSLIGVLPNQQRQFFAAVAGTADGNVQWSVDEGAAGGQIDDQGLYIAPGTVGTFHVTATSVADSAVSARATVLVAANGFLPADSMNFVRESHAATLLADGRVLITGGQGYQGSGNWTDLDTAELYDPKTGTFSETGRMTQRRLAHTATLLPTGEVLIAGGWNYHAYLATAEIYDPATGAFSATGSMGRTRVGHTATALLDGRILLAGGYTATAEVYDRVTRTFTAVGDLSAARSFHAATRLPDGRVLVTGGDTGSFSPCQSFSSTEIFDPAKAGFVLGPAMAAPRTVHTATLLPSGKVLLAGGYPDGSDGEWCDLLTLAHAELFDPAIGTAAAPIAMTVPRAGHTATLLPNDQVLLVDDSAELFDPATAVFALTGSPYGSGFRRTATLLLDGRVLFTGGTSSAELYYPN
jgi:hypothetical protein